MLKKKTLALFLLPLFGLASTILGQEEKPLYNVDFSVYLWPQSRFIQEDVKLNKTPELGYKDTNGMHWFQPREGRKTRSMHYTGTNPIRLYTRGTTASDDQTETTAIQPYAELTIPEGTRELVAFIFAESEGKSVEGYPLKRCRVMNIDSDNIQTGRPVFINLSQETIAFQYGDKQKIIPAGGVTSLPVSKDGGRSPVMLATQNQGKWQVNLTTSISLSHKARSVVLLEPIAGSNNWQIIRIIF